MHPCIFIFECIYTYMYMHMYMYMYIRINKHGCSGPNLVKYSMSSSDFNVPNRESLALRLCLDRCVWSRRQLSQVLPCHPKFSQVVLGCRKSSEVAEITKQWISRPAGSNRWYQISLHRADKCCDKCESSSLCCSFVWFKLSILAGAWVCIKGLGRISTAPQLIQTITKCTRKRPRCIGWYACQRLDYPRPTFVCLSQVVCGCWSPQAMKFLTRRDASLIPDISASSK